MSGYGMQGHVMLNAQDSFGTSQVTSLEAIPIVSEDLTFTLETLQEENMFGRFAQSPTHEGANLVEGTLTMEAEPQAIGHLFRMFVGSSSQDSDPSSGREHTFLMATADFDGRAAGTPFTLEVNRDVDSAFLYSSCIATGLEISIANSELMTVSVTLMGAGFGRKAASSPTYDADEVPFKWDQASASFGGAAINDIEDMTITFNKNLEAIYTLTNTLMPHKIKRSDTELIEISGTVLFQAHSYMQAFEAQSENRLFIHFVSNSPNTLTLDFPSFKFNTFNPVMDGKDVVRASFTGQANFNTSSSQSVQLTLTNVRTLSYWND